MLSDNGAVAINNILNNDPPLEKIDVAGDSNTLGSNPESIRESLLYWRVSLIGSANSGQQFPKTSPVFSFYEVSSFLSLCETTASSYPELWTDEFSKSVNEILSQIKALSQNQYQKGNGLVQSASRRNLTILSTPNRSSSTTSSKLGNVPEVIILGDPRSNILKKEGNKQPGMNKFAKKELEASAENSCFTFILTTICWLIVCMFIFFPFIFLCVYFIYDDNPDFLKNTNSTLDYPRYCDKLFTFLLFFACILTFTILANYCVALLRSERILPRFPATTKFVKKIGPRISLLGTISVLVSGFYAVILFWGSERDVEKKCRESSSLLTAIVACFFILPLLCLVLNYLAYVLTISPHKHARMKLQE